MYIKYNLNANNKHNLQKFIINSFMHVKSFKYAKCK